MFRIENCEIIHVNKKDGVVTAVLVESTLFDEPEWIPYSVIHDNSEVYEEGDEGDMIIKEWFAKKKGWV